MARPTAPGDVRLPPLSEGRAAGAYARTFCHPEHSEYSDHHMSAGVGGGSFGTRQLHLQHSRRGMNPPASPSPCRAATTPDIAAAVSRPAHPIDGRSLALHCEFRDRQLPLTEVGARAVILPSRNS